MNLKVSELQLGEVMRSDIILYLAVVVVLQQSHLIRMFLLSEQTEMGTIFSIRALINCRVITLYWSTVMRALMQIVVSGPLILAGGCFQHGINGCACVSSSNIRVNHHERRLTRFLILCQERWKDPSWSSTRKVALDPLWSSTPWSQLELSSSFLSATDVLIGRARMLQCALLHYSDVCSHISEFTEGTWTL